MKSRHGIECEDRRQVKMYGKGKDDDDGCAVKGMVKKSINDDYREGSRNLIRHLAAKYPSPNVKHHTRYCGVREIYATIDDAIDEKLVAVDIGYTVD